MWTHFVPMFRPATWNQWLVRPLPGGVGGGLTKASSHTTGPTPDGGGTSQGDAPQFGAQRAVLSAHSIPGAPSPTEGGTAAPSSGRPAAKTKHTHTRTRTHTHAHTHITSDYVTSHQVTYYAAYCDVELTATRYFAKIRQSQKINIGDVPQRPKFTKENTA